MENKPDHGAIEWRPTAWEGTYNEVIITVWRVENGTWAWRATAGRDAARNEGFADVMAAQRSAATWFYHWQKEQDKK